MNLLITLRCNQKCPYCFIENKRNLPDMTLEELEYIVNLPDFAEENVISILGGEPTLHSQLKEFLEMIHNKNRNPITIFSNLSNEPNIFKEIDIPNIILVANVLGNNNRISKNVEANLEIARRKGWTVVLSYTIIDVDFEINEIIDLCKKNGIKAVRWSLAMPASDRRNIYIQKHINMKIVKKLGTFIDKLLINGIVSFNDCPLPLCADVQKVSDVIKNKYNLPDSFQPIRMGICKPPYDVLPGYQIRGCMGIGGKISLDIRNFNSIKAIMVEYQKCVDDLRSLRILAECRMCKNFNDCGGGCLGYVRC